jgi:hypothetical protein
VRVRLYYSELVTPKIVDEILNRKALNRTIFKRILLTRDQVKPQHQFDEDKKKF